MVYFLGRHLKVDRLLVYELSTVFGIGMNRARKLCMAVGLSLSSKVGNLNDSQTIKLSRLIMNNYLIDSDLKKSISNNVKVLKKMSCYRGIRHSQGLPCRGQRTHTNANTAKRVKIR